MKKNTENILKEVLENIKISEKDEEKINNSLNEVLKHIKKNISKLRIDAEIFVGGSFAKETMIKTEKYDIDVFIRFDRKYKKEISELTGKILKGLNKTRIHGSRDYFRIKINPSFFVEIIPVKKIKNSRESENITDLSYSHVSYIKRKLKSKKILDEIRLAKAFCYANNCYGAESYISGFSGYSLELIVYYYGSFLKFIKAVEKMSGKVVIDIEKHFKNKQEILMDLNSSKLQSPIVLIDPTYKQRNTLAALSDETFEKFKKSCKKFLKNPRLDLFKPKKIDLEKIKKNAIKKGFRFVLIEIKTNKQKGDIAGGKLLKFYKHFNKEIENCFEIKNKGFEYNNGKQALVFFVTKNKKEILFRGPWVKDEKNTARFRKKHKNVFTRKSRLYSKEKMNFNIEEFLKRWKNKNKKKMNEMTIKELKIIG
ncbi:MAG: nucleotidyltransferase domain-containing protein [Nanoarchaeota archaeon]|nr:nucleotidyltransferase domain-containing protein [Nanoarchaeota archaeon]